MLSFNIFKGINGNINMDIKIVKTYKIRNNMVKSHILKGSPTYKRAKFMCLLNMKNRLYFKIPFRQHIEDIEQTLIDYGIKDERFLSSLWVSNSNIPLKRRIDIFGKDIVKLSFGFTRNNFLKESDKINQSSIRKSKDVITLLLAQRISNVNYAINTNDEKVFGIYVNSYTEFKKTLKSDIKEHEKMWDYLDLCCEEAGSINNLFFYI